MPRQWGKWEESKVSRIANAEDPAAEVWSCFGYVRKAFPDTEEGRRLKAEYTRKMMYLTWELISEMIAWHRANPEQ